LEGTATALTIFQSHIDIRNAALSGMAMKAKAGGRHFKATFAKQDLQADVSGPAGRIRPQGEDRPDEICPAKANSTSASSA